jgi:hypothetical protein
VVLTEAYLDLCPEMVGLRNVLCEVMDARLTQGGYVLTIGPVGNAQCRLEVDAEDVRGYVS